MIRSPWFWTFFVLAACVAVIVGLVWVYNAQKPKPQAEAASFAFVDATLDGGPR